MTTSAPRISDVELERHRHELTGYCYRMLGSSFDAEDAVQETFLRAWRARERFERRATLRTWLYRIATNVCHDLLDGRRRRAMPIDLGPAGIPVAANLNVPGDIEWIEPMASRSLAAEGSDPAAIVEQRDTMRLAFVAALQHLPPQQRAAVILKDVLNWSAAEIAELLDTTVAAVNSTLQRARATVASRPNPGKGPSAEVDPELLRRYVDAFERYDMDALTDLIHDDATQSMPPFDLWLAGRDDILAWWTGPGIGCRGSRLIPAGSVNGSPAFGQYKPEGDGYAPWALQVLELSDGRVADFTFFLSTELFFPRFGLPLTPDEPSAGPGLFGRDR